MPEKWSDDSPGVAPAGEKNVFTIPDKLSIAALIALRLKPKKNDFHVLMSVLQSKPG